MAPKALVWSIEMSLNLPNHTVTLPYQSAILIHIGKSTICHIYSSKPVCISFLYNSRGMRLFWWCFWHEHFLTMICCCIESWCEYILLCSMETAFQFRMKWRWVNETECSICSELCLQKKQKFKGGVWPYPQRCVWMFQIWSRWEWGRRRNTDQTLEAPQPAKHMPYLDTQNTRMFTGVFVWCCSSVKKCAL